MCPMRAAAAPYRVGRAVSMHERVGADSVPGADAARELTGLGTCLCGAVSLLGAYGGGVFLPDPGGNTLVLTVFTGLPPQFAGPWRRVPLDAPVGVAEAMRERELVWIGGPEEFAVRYPRAALTVPYRFSFACVPLSTGDRAHGVLFVNWPASHAPHLDAAERDQLWATASAMGRIVAHHPAVRPPPEPVALSGAAAPATGRDAVMSARLPEGLCELGVDGRVTRATPAAAEKLGVPLQELVGGIPWRVLPWLDHPVYEERYRRAAMTREPTGFVALRPPHRWLAFELYPDASGMTARITEAPDEAEQHPPAPRQSPTRLQEIYHVLHLAGALAKTTGVDDIVALIGEELVPVFGAARALLLAMGEDGRMRVTATHGYPAATAERLTGRSARAGNPATRVLAGGIPLFLETRQEIMRLYPRMADISNSAAWAVLPLTTPGQRAGVCVLSYDQPHRFTTEERATLTALAGLIAQGLIRARQYDTTRGLARDLQDALLPGTLPRIPGLEAAARYLPATRGMDVGGDFYDLIPLTRDRADAVIGDIQGHNATAAALMGQVRAAMRAHAADGTNPCRVLARTNRLITGLGTDLLASAAYVRLDTRRRRALITRAGHPQPLLRHPDGRVDVLDTPGGILLGVDAAATYPRTGIHLPAGAILALYTDGLTDIPGTNPDDALASLAQRLADAGPPDQPLDTIADHLLQGRNTTDDSTVLLLRLTDHPTGR